MTMSLAVPTLERAAESIPYQAIAAEEEALQRLPENAC